MTLAKLRQQYGIWICNDSTLVQHLWDAGKNNFYHQYIYRCGSASLMISTPEDETNSTNSSIYVYIYRFLRLSKCWWNVGCNILRFQPLQCTSPTKQKNTKTHPGVAFFLRLLPAKDPSEQCQQSRTKELDRNHLIGGLNMKELHSSPMFSFFIPCRRPLYFPTKYIVSEKNNMGYPIFYSFSIDLVDGRNPTPIEIYKTLVDEHRTFSIYEPA